MKRKSKTKIHSLLAALLSATLVLPSSASFAAETGKELPGSSSAAEAAYMTVDEIPAYDEVPAAYDAAALEALYDSRMGIDSAEVDALLAESPSELSLLEGLPKGSELINALKRYEVQKALYLLGEGSADEMDADTIYAWKRQKALNEFYYGHGASEIVALIPSISVLETAETEDGHSLKLAEWMIVGYSDRSISDVINYTAYRLKYSMTLSPDGLISDVENDNELFSEMDEAAAAPARKTVGSGAPVVSSGNDTSSGTIERRHFNSLPFYNVSGALAYADQWALSRNSAYSDYTGRGGDCANFVSQCLFAGGIPTDGTWYKDSKAWIAVIALSNWLCNTYGLERLPANNDNIQIGSPVCYQWHSNWQSSYSLNHVTLCVGRNAQGVPIVSGHTRDIKGSVWNYGYSNTSYMTIPLGGSAVGGSPVGCLDTITGGAGELHLSGWAYDPDHLQDPVDIHVYLDGPAGDGGTYLTSFSAGKNRADLSDAGYACGPLHGFDETIPVPSLGKHSFYVYAIDIDDINKSSNLENSPQDAEIASPYYVKIPKLSLTEGSSDVYKITFGGAEYSDVEWVVKDEDVIICKEDSSNLKTDKGWVKLNITAENAGSTKLIFKLLDNNGDVLFKKKKEVTVLPADTQDEVSEDLPTLTDQVLHKRTELDIHDWLEGGDEQTPTKFLSSDYEILNVDKETGKVQVLKTGTAIITVYFGEEKISKEYTVTLPELSGSLAVKKGHEKTVPITGFDEAAGTYSLKVKVKKNAVSAELNEDGTITITRRKKGTAKVFLYLDDEEYGKLIIN